MIKEKKEKILYIGKERLRSRGGGEKWEGREEKGKES